MKLDWETFSYDEEWLRAAASEEERCGVDVEAGVWLANRQTASADPTQLSAMMKTMRLQSILFTELIAWMESWNLGAGLDEAVICARQIVRRHLSHSSEAQQLYFEALLEEDEKAVDPPMLRKRVISQLREMLTQDDWQTIAQAASQAVKQRVMNACHPDDLPAVS
jgi:hypothetical protein